MRKIGVGGVACRFGGNQDSVKRFTKYFVIFKLLHKCKVMALFAFGGKLNFCILYGNYRSFQHWLASQCASGHGEFGLVFLIVI